MLPADFLEKLKRLEQPAQANPEACQEVFSDLDLEWLHEHVPYLASLLEMLHEQQEAIADAWLKYETLYKAVMHGGITWRETQTALTAQAPKKRGQPTPAVPAPAPGTSKPAPSAG